MDNKTKRPEVEVLARLYRQLGFLYMQSPLRLQALVYLDRTAKKQRASVAFFSVPLQLRLKQTWQESFAIYLKGLKRYRWTSSQESPFIAKVAQTQVSFFLRVQIPSKLPCILCSLSMMDKKKKWCSNCFMTTYIHRVVTKASSQKLLLWCFPGVKNPGKGIFRKQNKNIYLSLYKIFNSSDFKIKVTLYVQNYRTV